MKLIFLLLLVCFSTAQAATLKGTLNIKDHFEFNLKLSAPEINTEYAVRGVAIADIGWLTNDRRYAYVQALKKQSNQVTLLENNLEIGNTGGKLSRISGSLVGIPMSGSLLIRSRFGSDTTLDFQNLAIRSSPSFGAITRYKASKIKFGKIDVVNKEEKYGRPLFKSISLHQKTMGQRVIARETYETEFKFGDLQIKGNMACEDNQKYYTATTAFIGIYQSESAKCELDFAITSSAPENAHMLEDQFAHLLAFLQLVLPHTPTMADRAP